MEKYKVGVIGATGMVGQRFVTLLENHPWFQLTVVAASPRSAGKRYEDAVRVFERFLDEGRGWVENNIDACRHCARCLYGLCRAEEALLAFFRSFSQSSNRASSKGASFLSIS